MSTFYRDFARPVKGGIGKTVWGTVCGFALLGGLSLSMGCTGTNFTGQPTPPPPPPLGKFSVNATPLEVTTDENGPEFMVALPYQATAGLTAAYCQVSSLKNVDWTTRCSCAEGACRVGIRASPNVSGEGLFKFRFVDSAYKVSSDFGEVHVKIREVRLSAVPKSLEEAPVMTNVPLEALVQNSDMCPVKEGEVEVKKPCPVSGVKVTWKVFGEGGKLSSCADTSDEKGLVSCKWTLGAKAEAQRVGASIFEDEKEKNKAEFAITALAGPAAKLAFGDYPREGIAGGVLPTTVLIQDEYGNQTNSNARVVLDLDKSDRSKGGGALEEKEATAVSGKATLNPKIKKTGTYILRASAPSLGDKEAVGGDLVIHPGDAHHLRFNVSPGGGPAGEVWAQQPEVAVEDVHGNKVFGFFAVETRDGKDERIFCPFTVEVTLKPPSQNPPGGGSWKEELLGMAAIGTVEGVGVAAFGDLSAGGLVGVGYALEAKSPKSTTGPSTCDLQSPRTIVGATSGFSITQNGKPYQLEFTQQPSTTGQVNIALAQQPKLVIKDVYGNVAKDALPPTESPKPLDKAVYLLACYDVDCNKKKMNKGLEKAWWKAISKGSVDGKVSFENLSLDEADDYYLVAMGEGLKRDVSKRDVSGKVTITQ